MFNPRPAKSAGQDAMRPGREAVTRSNIRSQAANRELDFLSGQDSFQLEVIKAVLINDHHAASHQRGQRFIHPPGILLINAALDGATGDLLPGKCRVRASFEEAQYAIFFMAHGNELTKVRPVERATVRSFRMFQSCFPPS